LPPPSEPSAQGDGAAGEGGQQIGFGTGITKANSATAEVAEVQRTIDGDVRDLGQSANTRRHRGGEHAAPFVPLAPRRLRRLEAVPGRPRRPRLGGYSEMAVMVPGRPRLVDAHRAESARTITVREIKFTYIMPAPGPPARPRPIVHPGHVRAGVKESFVQTPVADTRTDQIVISDGSFDSFGKRCGGALVGEYSALWRQEDPSSARPCAVRVRDCLASECELQVPRLARGRWDSSWRNCSHAVTLRTVGVRLVVPERRPCM
jgi:hypothetical protein